MRVCIMHACIISMFYSGRAPQALTLERALNDGFGPSNPFPQNHGHAVTVPGAAAAWADTVERYGSGNVI